MCLTTAMCTRLPLLIVPLEVYPRNVPYYCNVHMPPPTMSPLGSLPSECALLLQLSPWKFTLGMYLTIAVCTCLLLQCVPLEVYPQNVPYYCNVHMPPPTMCPLRILTLTIFSCRSALLTCPRFLQASHRCEIMCFVDSVFPEPDSPDTKIHWFPSLSSRRLKTLY